MQNSKTICPYCKKERRAELMFRIEFRKNYRCKKICHLCYPQYTQGKRLVNNRWVGYRKPTEVKIKTYKEKEFKFTKYEARTLLKGIVKTGRPSADYPVEFRRQEALEKLLLDNYLD